MGFPHDQWAQVSRQHEQLRPLCQARHDGGLAQTTKLVADQLHLWAELGYVSMTTRRV